MAHLLFKDHDKEKFKIDEITGKPVPLGKSHLIVKQFNELKSIVSGSANKDGEVCTEMLISFVQQMHLRVKMLMIARKHGMIEIPITLEQV